MEDADICKGHRWKVSFRGFRGRCRLTWKVAGEGIFTQLVDVK